MGDGIRERRTSGRSSLLSRKLVPAISCVAISKAFLQGGLPAQQVLRDLSVEIRSGELFSLLGPSGCGKSTLLRIIAGLERPDSGTVRVGGSDITAVPPHLRGIGMVFQQYALFPHLTVSENVRFGLEVARDQGRRLTAAEQTERCNRALEAVRLRELADRYPDQLSGGQQQRVAVARALAIEPQIILLDEPLSNLDVKLRTEIRAELRALHAERGLTTIHVTHDQEEALTISDRIAVMMQGRIAQLGTPEMLYDHPATLGVASFLGETNIIEGTVARRSGAGGEVGLPHELTIRFDELPEISSPGRAVTLMFRPERAEVLAAGAPLPPDAALIVPGTVTERRFSGATVRLGIRPDAERLPELTAVSDASPFHAGERVAVCVRRSALRALPPEAARE